MISTTNLFQLFKHPKVLETYSNYLKLVSSEYPEMNYIGINFNDKGISSVKFYFAFFHRLSKKEILQFIPHTKDLDKYFYLWEESKIRSLEHTGCTFEVKFKGSLTPTFGFHFRLKPTKESYDLIGHPKNIPFDVLQLGTRPGINYEYLPTGVLRKKYYYFEKQEHKDYFSEMFKKPFVKDVSLIEYTEANKITKANFWRFDYSKENMNRPNYFSESERKIIDKIKEKYRLVNVSEGFYKNDVEKATYFFNTKNNESITVFDDDENFNIDTIKQFL